MSIGSSWLALLLAGLLEMAFAIGLKASGGLARPWVMTGTVLALLGSQALLLAALRQLPVGTAHVVWTGIGVAGTALLGMWLPGDPASLARRACICLIVGGVVGLRLV